MLDLVVIPAGSRLKLAWRAYGLRSGRIGEQREVGARRCREARIAAPSGIPFNVDGEIVDARSARFSAEPAAFALIVPSAREGR
jgi:diacylglycerol kinase family enzyme